MALKTHHQSLRSGIQLRNIFPALRPLLTEVECLLVEGKEDNVAQVDALVSILLTKEYKHFKGFCTALDNNGYEHWAKMLQGEVDGVGGT